MNMIFLLMAYFPVISGVIGCASLLTYTGFRVFKSRRYNALVIIGCIGGGLTLLVYSAFFLAGYLGIGPINS